MKTKLILRATGTLGPGLIFIYNFFLFKVGK